MSLQSGRPAMQIQDRFDSSPCISLMLKLTKLRPALQPQGCALCDSEVRHDLLVRPTPWGYVVLNRQILAEHDPHSCK